MSLKPFHIVLMSSAILMAAGLAAWAFRRYAVSGLSSDLWTGAGSLAMGLALSAYLFWFLKKMKEKGW